MHRRFLIERKDALVARAWGGVGRSPTVERFRALLATSAPFEDALERLAAAAPGAWLVSGALVQSVWNALTDRASTHGIDDLDVAYWDDDRSYGAEDRAIVRIERALTPSVFRVEARNQARVHRWFERKFGLPYTPLRAPEHATLRYPTKTSALAIRRRADGSDELYAPFGVGACLTLEIRPNRRLANRRAYEKKAARWQERWPELRIEPW